MPGARKLGRTTDHRKAMLRAMVTFLLENGKIETTVTRAKEVRAMAEKMITIAKANDLHSKRQVYSYITKETVAKKVMDEIAPKYADRNGGYTRVLKIGPRRGDGAEMAIIMMVDASAVYDKKPAKDEKSAKKSKDDKKTDTADKAEKKPVARKKAAPKTEPAESAAAEA